jgi:menaquinone-dependent protoporphyrinogen oxidase
MSRVHVVYATRHHGTAGIAERIATVLRADCNEVALADAAGGPDPSGFAACVVGSGAYMGSRLKEGIEFLDRNASTHASRPTWLFSSGPLPHASKSAEEKDVLTQALGPAEGPRSGGRKRIDALSAAILPRDHRVFLRAFDPQDPPKSLPERFVRLMPAAERVLPPGDYRGWGAVEASARQIAAALSAPVATAAGTTS